MWGRTIVVRCVVRNVRGDEFGKECGDLREPERSIVAFEDQTWKYLGPSSFLVFCATARRLRLISASAVDHFLVHLHIVLL